MFTLRLPSKRMLKPLATLCRPEMNIRLAIVAFIQNSTQDFIVDICSAHDYMCNAIYIKENLLSFSKFDTMTWPTLRMKYDIIL